MPGILHWDIIESLQLLWFILWCVQVYELYSQCWFSSQILITSSFICIYFFINYFYFYFILFCLHPLFWFSFSFSTRYLNYNKLSVWNLNMLVLLNSK